MFITVAIEAAEGRDVAITDLPNAFGQTDCIKNDEDVEIIMIIIQQLADLLIEIAPDVLVLWQTMIKRKILCFMFTD